MPFDVKMYAYFYTYEFNNPNRRVILTIKLTDRNDNMIIFSGDLMPGKDIDILLL